MGAENLIRASDLGVLGVIVSTNTWNREPWRGKWPSRGTVPTQVIVFLSVAHAPERTQPQHSSGISAGSGGRI